MCINRRSQVLLDGAAQRALRHRPDDGVNLLTILEDHHSRDRTNTVLGRDARGFIRVELHLHRLESINRLHRQSLASPFVAPSSSFALARDVHDDVGRDREFYGDEELRERDGEDEGRAF